MFCAVIYKITTWDNLMHKITIWDIKYCLWEPLIFSKWRSSRINYLSELITSSELNLSQKYQKSDYNFKTRLNKLYVYLNFFSYLMC